MKTIDELLPYINLKMNLEHPDLEACYAEGYQCALMEGLENESPFGEDTVEHQHWIDGWWDGYYREEPMFNVRDYFMASDEEPELAANDEALQLPEPSGFLTKVIELSGVIAVSAILGYQMIDMVA